MPNPWDEQNLLKNLQTIARLSAGDKLSVVKSGAMPDINYRGIGSGGRSLRPLFEIQKGGFLHKAHQAAVRKKKGESLLNDNQYLLPLTKLFQEANRRWHEGKITVGSLQSAYQGLCRMLNGYSGARYRTKAGQIRNTIKPILPRPDREKGIHIEGNQTVNLLNRPELGELKNWVYAFLKDNVSSSGGLRSEAEEKIKIIESIYGPSYNPMPATQLPTNPGKPYVRKGIGVCQASVKDWERKPHYTINGKVVRYGQEGVQKLLEALLGDEGMMFIISQLANQGGLGGITNDLVTYKKPQNKRANRFEFPFHCKGKWIAPQWCPVTYDIKTTENSSSVEARSSFGVNAAGGIFACDLWNDLNHQNIDLTKTGADLGIRQFSTTFTMKLRREGFAIHWDLIKADLLFKEKGLFRHHSPPDARARFNP